MDMERMLFLAPSILLGLTLHELAHGLVAYWLGDPTAKSQGRLTLNPLKHLDLLGTIMLFVVQFGWAKPVPVDTRYLKNPKKDMMYIALAGPLTNLVLAFLFAQVLKFTSSVQVEQNLIVNILYQVSYWGLIINVSLAVFNLLPIPPLDGSRVLFAFIPKRYDVYLHSLEKFGGIALLGLLLLGNFTGFSFFGVILLPMIKIFVRLFIGEL